MNRYLVDRKSKVEAGSFSAESKSSLGAPRGRTASYHFRGYLNSILWTLWTEHVDPIGDQLTTPVTSIDMDPGGTSLF